MRILLVFQILSFGWSFGQDISYAKRLIDKLSGKEFWGRGYTNDGMSKAADFLESEFKSYGLAPLSGKDFQQSFNYPVNTFPGKAEVSINGIHLKPGEDFIISPESDGIKFSGKLIQKDSAHFVDEKNRIEVALQEKLSWSVATEEKDYTRILIKKKFDGIPSSIKLQIENKFIPRFKASNVCGMIRGSKKPDSLIVISAHYDHLGGMGDETYFPGANDNASGLAHLLSLAQYYSKNPPSYSIIFICFAGEEAGLIGSKYFVENSLISLDKIRFLINLDLTGTGDEGITVVNGSVLKTEFGYLNDINVQKNYLSKIKARGKAANSDHYWFTESGVPSFFIYTLGGIQAYHDVYDRPETLPLTEFEDLFRLIIDFNDRIMK
jgi:hypothetical protein